LTKPYPSYPFFNIEETIMISKSDWNIIFLKHNPFDLSPPIDPKQTIWAGMDQIKKQFHDIFHVAVSSSTTQVVLNRGPVGGGKTHALVYFSYEDNLSQITENQIKVHHININVPKEPGNSAEEFYTNLLDTIGMTRVTEIIRDAVAHLSKGDVIELLQQVLGSEELARAFWMLATTDSVEILSLLRTFFLTKSTSADLKKLGLARNITTARDRFRVVAGIFQCLIGLNINTDSEQHSRVCFWIDEMEDLMYITSSQSRLVTQGLRDIIDLLPNYFTLFLNMTLADPHSDDEFDIVLGSALIDRITDVIFFPELSIDEAEKYVDELMNNPQHRIISDQLKGLPRTYPFEEAALKMLLDGLQKKTPREINKRCRNVINFAFRANKFTSPGNRMIDTTFVKELEESELDREIV